MLSFPPVVSSLQRRGISGSKLSMVFKVRCSGVRAVSSFILLGVLLLSVVAAFYLRLISGSEIGINWDTGLYYNGAYRVFLGQRPHVDFSQVTGSLVSYIGALGFYVGGLSSYGYECGVALFCALVVGQSQVFYLLLGRVAGLSMPRSLILAILCTVYSAPMICSGTMLSYGFDKAHTGLYNKIGQYLLVQILIAQVFIAHVVSRPNHHIVPKKLTTALFLCVGVFGAMCCVTKVSYAGLACILVGASVGHFVFTSGLKHLRATPQGMSQLYSVRRWTSWFWECVRSALLPVLVGLVPSLVLLVHWDFYFEGIIRDFNIAISAKAQRGLPEIYGAMFKYGWCYFSLALSGLLFLLREFFLGALSLVWFLFASPLISYATGQPPAFEEFGVVLFPIGLRFLLLLPKTSGALARVGSIALGLTLISVSVYKGHVFAYRDLWRGLTQTGDLRPSAVVAAMKARSDYVDHNFVIPVFNDTDRLLQRCPELKGESFIFIDAPDLYSIVRALPMTNDTPIYWHHGFSFHERHAYFQRPNFFQGVGVIAVQREIHFPTVSKFYELYQEKLKDMPKVQIGESMFFYSGSSAVGKKCFESIPMGDQLL